MTRESAEGVCRLQQWPCKLGAIPETAPYLDGADILIAADCSAYAYGKIHADFMHGKITLIACPLHNTRESTEKLINILKNNRVSSLTLLRMEVACCDALEKAVAAALAACGRKVSVRTVTLTTDGRVLSDTE